MAESTFHPNPQVRRMRETKAPKAEIHKPAEKIGEHAAEKGHVELHHGPSAGGSGKFHTVHHPGGESKDHATLHEAHHSMNEHMGEDGCAGDGNCEHEATQDAGADPEMDMGGADPSDSGAEY